MVLFECKCSLIDCLIPFLNKPSFYVSVVQVFRKHGGKRRNCSERAISPFPTVSSTSLKNLLQLLSNLKLLAANSFSLEESKICRLGKSYASRQSMKTSFQFFFICQISELNMYILVGHVLVSLKMLFNI